MVAQDFFQQKISREEFCWYFPPRLFQMGIRHLFCCKSRGVGVFVLWAAVPIFTKFLWRGHIPGCVSVFRILRDRFFYSDHCFAKNKIWGSVDVLLFEFDMARENALDIQLHPSFCVQKGCSLCLP